MNELSFFFGEHKKKHISYQITIPTHCYLRYIIVKNKKF